MVIVFDRVVAVAAVVAAAAAVGAVALGVAARGIAVVAAPYRPVVFRYVVQYWSGSWAYQL